MHVDKLKGRPSFPFETIAVAVAFTAKLDAILSEAKLLATRFQANLLLIHVGNKTPEKTLLLAELCEKIGVDSTTRTIWASGDVIPTLLDICKNNVVDLLILGARRRENLFRYYLGSIARDVSRRAKCSLLLLTDPQASGTPMTKMVVDCVEHGKTPHTLATACYCADRLAAKVLYAVREVDESGLAMAMSDESTTGEKTKVREQLVNEAKQQVKALVDCHPAQGTQIATKVLIGRPGYAIRRFTEEENADILVVHSPDGRYRVVDRIFTHGMEHILERLPCNLLIVHTRMTDNG